ncbi:MAG: adenylate/guanylate cyclase domain-containing protein [Pseudorhodoplanes sp.]
MTDRQPRFCLPFRISISLAFALISLPVLLAVIGAQYVRNVNLAREVAVDLIDRATKDISEHVEALLVPLARVVDATTTFAKIDPETLRKPETFQYLLTVLQSTPHAEMLYVGFQRDGAFFQVRRLHPDQKPAGPSPEAPPPDANFVLRTIDPNTSIIADISTYIAKWGQVVGIERKPPVYDPRSRPWYIAARNKAGLSISDAYIFFSTGQPGLTLSHNITTDAGASIGAVGIDISLGALSEFLARQRIGKNGIAFIVDNNGALVGYPKLDAIVAQKGSELIIKKANEIDDPRIVQAVTLRGEGAGNQFVAELENGTNFISFTPLPARFGKDWLIGVIAAENDFVGPIRYASLFTLAVGSAALLLSVLAILYVSGSLTSPLKRIVNETKRIRQFELNGGAGVHSRIVEINELANALSAMEAGLRSFGAYIPKALVRTIVSSGKDTGIGGERRELTILFTDIQDFTQRSETMPAEEVFDQLSAHFTALSRCIFERGGTVDKFIGDSVMAFWNAPASDPDHAANACYAVLRGLAINNILNAELEAKGHAPLRTRFGLHSGEAAVGNVGSADRMQYTALGAPVNLASRVEGLNKRYGTLILATESVEEKVRDRFVFRPLDLVVPAGTTQIVPLFELLGTRDDGPDAASEATITSCKEWSEAIAGYRSRNWNDAFERFRRFADRHPSDPVAPLYIERCRLLLSSPPPSDWDGAERFDSK